MRIFGARGDYNGLCVTYSKAKVLEDNILLFSYGRITVWLTYSVTRLGDLLDFGQILKPLATIDLAKSPHILKQIL